MMMISKQHNMINEKCTFNKLYLFWVYNINKKDDQWDSNKSWNRDPRIQGGAPSPRDKLAEM